MTTTASLVVVTQYLVDKLVANKATLAAALSVDPAALSVFYGDQDQIPTGYALCVEPDNKRRTLNGAARRTKNDFSVGILVYAGVVTDPQTNRKNADTVAEAIETLVHADATFGTNPNQLLIHSLCESIESGYARKNNSTIRTSRIMVTGTSQSILPPNP